MLDHYHKKPDGQGRMAYWLDGRMPDAREHPDTDLHALSDGYVALTPLRFDLTHHAAMSQLSGLNWFAGSEDPQQQPHAPPADPPQPSTRETGRTIVR
jgi:hypothetical protein